VRLALALLALLLPAAVLAGPPIIVSERPEAVDITLYRDPGRRAGVAIDFKPADPEDWEEEPLGGFALVNEERTVELPPGEVTIRFEGVASGIVPQSAILFDTDLAEKNFDSRLLSKRGLLDAFTGQAVTIRRTDRKSGKEERVRGTILSLPDELVLRTPGGIEAVQCDGSINTLLFPHRPIDLTAKPTLSLTTRPDNPGGKVKLRLAYLAGNFDWQANYIGTFSADGAKLRLQAWMTLASHDRTSFTDAKTSAAAGTVFRDEPTDEEQEAASEERDKDPYAPDNIDVGYSCWPSGRTSASTSQGPLFTPGSLPELDRPYYVSLDGYGFGAGGGCTTDEDGEETCDESEIIVTAQMRVSHIEVGDTKLYTVARPTTVAAQSMKQVRLFPEREVKGELLYRVKCSGDYCDDPELLFRFTNDAASGLGEPLPKGQIALFQQTTRGRHVLGEAPIEDRTTDEEVDVILPDASGYSDKADADNDEIESGEHANDLDWTKQELKLSNKSEVSAIFEVEFRDTDNTKLERFSKSTINRKGARVWRVELPPTSERKITYRTEELPRFEQE
jgi:hypothetical protein